MSIAFVAAEILHSRQGKPGLTERYPWIVAFTFGLLHGFGFAGAMKQVGLPQTEIPIALLFFNVGVEVGQLLFIAAVFAIFWLLRRSTRGIKMLQTTWVSVLPAYVIGSLAMFWVVQRTAAFFRRTTPAHTIIALRFDPDRPEVSLIPIAGNDRAAMFVDSPLGSILH